MNRLTIRKNGSCSVADTDTAVRRLAAYEDILETLEREQAAIPFRLAELRAAGKEKTVTYRELLVKRLQAAYILDLFRPL